MCSLYSSLSEYYLAICLLCFRYYQCLVVYHIHLVYSIYHFVPVIKRNVIET